MKFLVILICLMVNYLWLKDFDRFDDGWFFRFRCRVEEWSVGLADKFPLGWIVAVVLVYAIPLFSLAVILFITGDSLFGLATMLVHILVLLVALDRTQPGQQAKDFLEKWKAEDWRGCVDFLGQQFSISALPSEEDRDAISRCFSKQLAYYSFEKMFVMFFWYMCTGALGVLFCYVSYQWRDSQSERQLQKQVDLVALLIQLLEWIPLRLLALTFSLAGNFVQCFENVRNSFWQFSKDCDNAEMLYGYANCASSGMLAESLAGVANEEAPDKESAEIQALLGLLERSQAIWLSVLALITIVGL
ncbi:MAG: regulatory signaling modulator protein AmpE [Pseudohongiellaceae bacterium]